MKKHKLKGFSIVELFVVMAVLAVLVMIAMPWLSGQRTEVNAAKITSDIKVVRNLVENHIIEKRFVPAYRDVTYDIPQYVLEGKIYGVEGLVTDSVKTDIYTNFKILSDVFIEDSISSAHSGVFLVTETRDVFYLHENLDAPDSLTADAPSITTSPDTDFTNGGVTVEITYAADVVTKQYNINIGEWQEYTGSFTINDNSTVFARGIDDSGNPTEVSSKNVNNIDNVAPETNVVTTILGDGSVEIVITASDEGSGVDYIQLPDLSIINTDSATITVSVTGDYEFKVVDNVGNETTQTVPITATVDTTPPVVTFNPDGNSTPRRSHLSIVTVTDDTDVASSNYQWTNSSVFPTTGVWTPFVSESILSKGGEVGDYYLHVEATDTFGNRTETTSQPFVLSDTATASTCPISDDLGYSIKWVTYNGPDGMTYQGFEIHKYDGRDKDVVIPEQFMHIDGNCYDVVGIGNNAFHKLDLTSVTVPDTVKYLGNNSFHDVGAFGDNPLVSIHLPDGLLEIGNNAFHNNDIEAISFPDSVKLIGNNAFHNNKLKNVNIGKGVTDIGDDAFYSDDSTNFNQLLNIELPENVQNVGKGAFKNNKIKYVEVNGTTNINVDAFDYSFSGTLDGFYDVDAGNWTIVDTASYFTYTTGAGRAVLTGLTPAGQAYFGTELIIPSKIKVSGTNYSVVETGTASFSIKMLTYVHLPESLEIINTYSFELNRLVGTLIIPNSVVEIGTAAFDGYMDAGEEGRTNQLSKVILGNNLQIIGNYAFAQNDLTGTLVVPNSVVEIGSGAFDGYVDTDMKRTNRLSKVILGDSLEVIGSYAFAQNNLTGTLVIPDSVLTIGTCAFSGSISVQGERTNQLTGLILGSSLQTIGDFAFETNRLSGDLIIPNTVTSIGEWAFYTDVDDGTFVVESEGNQITGLTLSDNLQALGVGAFDYNDINGTVVVPNNVTILEQDVFRGNNISNIVLPEGLTEIGYNAMLNNPIETLVIPSTVTKINSHAFRGCNLSSLVIPNNVVEIMYMAFSENQLTEITIPVGIILGIESVSQTFDDAYAIGGAGTYTAASQTGIWTKQTVDEVVYPIIHTGSYHNHAITESGSIYSWGTNFRGQLGRGDTTNVAVPELVLTDKSVEKLILHGEGTSVITSSGELYSYGYNTFGRLGLGASTSITAPTLVPGLSGEVVIDVAQGENHGFVFTESGNIYAYGRNDYGQLGLGDTTNRTTPVLVPALSGIGVTKIEVKAYNNHALTNNGEVYAWGRDGFYQLGLGDILGRQVPTLMTGLSDKGIVDIEVGAGAGFAFDSNGNVYGWGDGESAGSGSDADIPLPVIIPELSNKDIKEFIYIENSSYGFVITTSNEIYSWGNGWYGKLGHGDENFLNTPTAIATLSGKVVKELLTDGTSIILLLEDGSVYSWGNNSNGELGHGDLLKQYSPTLISGLSGVNVVDIIMGQDHVFAITDTGDIYAWGRNIGGELALGDLGADTNRLIPTLVNFDFSGGTEPTGTSQYVEINKSFMPSISHTFMHSVTGKVYSYGDYAVGKLGLGTLSKDVTTPTELTFFNSIPLKEIHASYDWSIALTESGELYAWGDAYYGISGNGSSGFSAIDIWSPERITYFDGNPIMDIDAGRYHVLALTENGDVYAWGDNGDGQIALDPVVARYDVPTKISFFDGMNVASVFAGEHSNFVLTDTGELYVWGLNDTGQLGLGDTINRITPERVAFFDDKSIEKLVIGLGHNFAILDTGAIYAWGDNAYAELGFGNTNVTLTPTEVTNFGSYNIVDIIAGASETYIVTDIGEVYSWGRNLVGQLGHGDLVNMVNPTKITALDGVAIVELSTLYSTVIAVSDTGAVYGWGRNLNGQLGDGSNNPSNHYSPILISFNFQ